MGNRRKFDLRTGIRCLEDVAEVAGQAVRNINCRGRQAAQRFAQSDARRRAQQRRFARRKLLAAQRNAALRMRQARAASPS
jgi:hypothetical protein